MIETISSMHSTFLKYSKLDCRQMPHERTWYELVKAGYTSYDVEIFLQWVLWENAQREPCFRRVFHIPKMFGDIANFDADLTLARAWHRNRRGTPTPKETALEQLRPTVDPELTKARLNPARSAEEVLGRILRQTQQP